MKFISKAAQNLNIVAAIMNSTQQPGPTFMTLFRPKYFIQVASNKPSNYHSHIILSQTCSKLPNESIEDDEVDNRLEKIDFADLVKDVKSVAGFSPSGQFLVDFT